MSELRDDDDDFEPRPPEDVALEALIRGVGRRELAEELGVPLATVNERVAQAVRMRSGAAGTLRERLAVVDATLDEATRRAFQTLDSDTETTAPLLAALVTIQRLRVDIALSGVKHG